MLAQITIAKEIVLLGFHVPNEIPCVTYLYLFWRIEIVFLLCTYFSFLTTINSYQWIRRKGEPAPREIAPIVVSNHVSYIDPIFYFYELFPTIVAAESHDSIPFVGTIIRAMQVTFAYARYLLVN